MLGISDAWSTSCLSINPATHHTILKIVGFLIVYFKRGIWRKKYEKNKVISNLGCPNSAFLSRFLLNLSIDGIRWYWNDIARKFLVLWTCFHSLARTELLSKKHGNKFFVGCQFFWCICVCTYCMVSNIRPGRLRLLEIKIEIVLVVL